MKRVTSIFISIMLLITSFAGTVFAENNSNPDWKTLYSKKIEEIKQEYATGIRVNEVYSNSGYGEHSLYFSVQDFNFDGIPELYHTVCHLWEAEFWTPEKSYDEVYYIKDNAVVKAQINSEYSLALLPLYQGKKSLGPSVIDDSRCQCVMRNQSTNELCFIASNQLEWGWGDDYEQTCLKITFNPKTGVVNAETLIRQHEKYPSEPELIPLTGYDFIGVETYSDSFQDSKWKFNNWKPIDISNAELTKYNFAKLGKHTFKFDDKISVDINWGWELFNKNASEYDHNLAMAAICLCRRTYNFSSSEMDQIMKDFGVNPFMHIQYTEKNAITDSPAHSVGATRIILNNKEKILITVIIKGTTFAWEGGDISTNTKAYYNGYLDASSNVFETVEICLPKIESEFDCTLNKDNTIFYITGHSMGGAVAGLIANKALKYAEQDNIFTYTFASVNYDTEKNDYTKYTNVHNIINSNDGFRHYPYGVNYKRYGQDWWYDYKDYEDESKAIHEKLGIKENAHSTETYLACLLSGLPKNMGNGVSTSYSLSSIHCPVDISVSDEKGNKLGYTSGSNVILSNKNEIFICIDGDSKYIVSPTDKKYRIEFVATDEGTMSYSQAIVDEVSNEIVNEKTFSNVELETGKLMVAEIGKDVNIEDIKLFVHNKAGNIIAEIDTNGKEHRKLNIIFVAIPAIVILLIVILLVIIFKKKKAEKNELSETQENDNPIIEKEICDKCGTPFDKNGNYCAKCGNARKL